MSNTRTLPQIAKAIKVLEKKTIANVVEIGKLLEEASEKYHGEYRSWLKSEFSWSHDTARNYRNVYTFAKMTKISSFDKLNISVSALYLAADDWSSHKAASNAIINAAKKGRVSYTMALDILMKSEESKPPAPQPSPEEPEIEPLEKDEELPAVDVDGDAPEQRWRRSLADGAGDAIGLQAYWMREFGDWEKFERPADLVTLAKQAANVWLEIAAKLNKSSAVKLAADRAEARSKVA